MKRYPEVSIQKRPFYVNGQYRGEEIIALTQLRIMYEGVWYLQTFRQSEFLQEQPSDEEILTRAAQAIHVIHSYVYQHVVLGRFNPLLTSADGFRIHEVDVDQREETKRIEEDFFRCGSPSKDELLGLLKK
jgi:hypothetical protein